MEHQKNKGIRIIFLDIDGVLNSENFSRRERRERYYGRNFDGKFQMDPRAIALLNELVKRTNAYLVLSSTWRLGVKGLDFTKNALAMNGFEHNDRFLGKTPRLHRTSEGEPRVRGHEIQNWLDTLGDASPDTVVDSFVILDDDSDMAELLPRLVRTSYKDGLTPWKCEEAEKILLKSSR